MRLSTRVDAVLALAGDFLVATEFSARGFTVDDSAISLIIDFLSGSGGLLAALQMTTAIIAKTKITKFFERPGLWFGFGVDVVGVPTPQLGHVSASVEISFLHSHRSDLNQDDTFVPTFYKPL